MKTSNNRIILGCILLVIPGWLIYSQTQIRPDALAEYRNGNYERATSICKDEIRVNPRNLDAHVVICWSLIRLNRYQEALEYARLGRVISRYDPRIVEILGEINYYEGRNV